MFSCDRSTATSRSVHPSARRLAAAGLTGLILLSLSATPSAALDAPGLRRPAPPDIRLPPCDPAAARKLGTACPEGAGVQPSPSAGGDLVARIQAYVDGLRGSRKALPTVAGIPMPIAPPAQNDVPAPELYKRAAPSILYGNAAK
jgi:hypothetical protein